MNDAAGRATTVRPCALARIGGRDVAVYVGHDGQVWGDFGRGQQTLANSGDAVAWLEINLPPSEDRERLIRGAGTRLENLMPNGSPRR